MLDPKTIELMKEYFKDKKCNTCGKVAIRCRRHRFYCLDCWTDRETEKKVEMRENKTHFETRANMKPIKGFCS